VSSLPPGAFRIDREGVWHHEGQEVTHPGVLRNLYANLRAEAGAHYLQVGSARVPVDVADAPFVVTRVEIEPEAPGALRLHLSDGSEETIDPAGVWLEPGGAPYCRVRGGGFRARFSVPAWLQLAERLEEEPGSDRAWLVLGGRRMLLTRRD
jgi:hypothetical protein